MKHDELMKAFANREKRDNMALIIHMYIRYGIRPEAKEGWDETNRKSFLLYSMRQDHEMALMLSPKGTKLVCTHEWEPEANEKLLPVLKVGNVYTVSDSEVSEGHHWKTMEGLSDRKYSVHCFDFAPGEMPSPEEALALYGDTFADDYETANSWYQAVLDKERQEKTDALSSFTPNDLKNGDIVVFRCGEKGICIGNYETIYLQYGGSMNYDHFEDNMENSLDDDIHSWDIMRVLRGAEDFLDEDCDYVYDRNNLKQLTTEK